MKKKIVMAIGTIAGAAILGFGIYHSEASQTESNLSAEEIEKKVTAQYPGEITAINLEKQANKSVYMVDIDNAPRVYSLTVDSNTGEVIELEETSDPEQVKIAEKKEKTKEKAKEKAEEEKKEKEKATEKQSDQKNKAERKSESNTKEDNDSSKKQDNKKSESKPAEKNNTVISVDKATEIALEQFSGEVDEVELDKEDGRLIYEIEIENGEDEAEIEIDAYTGEVLVVSIDRD